MDLAPTPPTAHALAPATAKSPEPDPEPTPTRIQPAKPLSFGNGILKRHSTTNHANHHAAAPAAVVTYRECLKNHAASLGGHALDGCGEFMPSPAAVPADPSSLKCAACGCHRNFHRRDPDDPLPSAAAPATHVIEYQPHHRHHPPPPPPPPLRSPSSASPPPISSSFYPSAPHMLLALSSADHNSHQPALTPPSSGGGSGGRKRFRTKFSQGQKEKMFRFAERVGWKMQKRDEDLVREFCGDAGVDRGVLKVWMHNNKNTFAKKDGSAAAASSARNTSSDGGDDEHNASDEAHHNHHHNHHHHHDHHVGTNGSSSSS